VKKNKNIQITVDMHHIKNHCEIMLNHFFNHIKYNEEIAEEFIFPLKSSNTYAWWDVKPYKPKVF